MQNPKWELHKLFLSWLYISQVFHRESKRDVPGLRVCPDARAGTGPIPLKIRRDGEQQKTSAQAEEQRSVKYVQSAG